MQWKTLSVLDPCALPVLPRFRKHKARFACTSTRCTTPAINSTNRHLDDRVIKIQSVAYVRRPDLVVIQVVLDALSAVSHCHIESVDDPTSADLLWANTFQPKLNALVPATAVINHFPRSVELTHK